MHTKPIKLVRTDYCKRLLVRICCPNNVIFQKSFLGGAVALLARRPVDKGLSYERRIILLDKRKFIVRLIIRLRINTGNRRINRLDKFSS